MADFASISIVLGSLKQATEILGAIRESDKQLEVADLKYKLADVLEALAKAKIEALEVQVALAEQKTEIKDLRDRLNAKAAVKWEPPYYFKEKGEGRDGPYCQKCYDSSETMARLQETDSAGRWYCRVCQEIYVDKDFVKPQEKKQSRVSSNWVTKYRRDF